MFDVARSLTAALGQARRDLQTAERTAVRAQRGAGGRTADAAMAATARAALFSEALLGAVRARLAEIKAVAK